ncbi:MAG: sulfite exporter TauE/SafE family protein [Acidimicrobiales bacterium]
MRLWGVFVTGLFAGGASCAVVQGGLLAGLVARRQPVPDGERPKNGSAAAGAGRQRSRPQGLVADDAMPVAGFLAGKLVSHTLLGAALGLLGDAVQIGFRARAVLLVLAGAVMVAMALNLLGVRALARLVPAPPAAWARLLRRNARSAHATAPALLGFATVLLPCGVTLSMEFLAIASGSAVAGAAIMAVFVAGTSPLFALLGYAARRSATLLRGRLAKLAGVAVLFAGLLSINSGLVLSGSGTTLGTVWGSLTGRGSTGATAAAPLPEVASDGVQRVVISVRDTGYSPSVMRVKAGVPTEVTFRTQGTTGCTRSVVVPSLRLGRVLPATGDTKVDVGRLQPGRLRYTCGMGMYSGTIEAA